MSKHGLEGVSVVWWFTLIFTICHVYASKWLRRELFSFFLWLEHGKTFFGRCFCCLVIYANLHKMPEFIMHGKIKQTWEKGWKRTTSARKQNWAESWKSGKLMKKCHNSEKTKFWPNVGNRENWWKSATTARKQNWSQNT